MQTIAPLSKLMLQRTLILLINVSDLLMVGYFVKVLSLVAGTDNLIAFTSVLYFGCIIFISHSVDGERFT
jgi:hypothetical protein